MLGHLDGLRAWLMRRCWTSPFPGAGCTFSAPGRIASLVGSGMTTTPGITRRLFPCHFHGWALGWFRLWKHGPGLAWKPDSEPRLYSERHGFQPTLCTLRGVRFRYLPRW